MLGKIDNVPMGDGATDSDKSYWNTKMLAHYNLGI